MNQRFLGLRTVIYKVPDMPRAREWYTEAFEQAPYFDEAFYIGFNISGYELGLQPQDSHSIERSGSVLTYWGVSDVAKEFERLILIGAEPHENPQDVGGGIVVASLLDPWGNLIGIINNPHFNLS